MPRTLVQKTLGEILYLLICSFLPCLSWLLHSRVRKSRRDLWITMYLSEAHQCSQASTHLSRCSQHSNIGLQWCGMWHCTTGQLPAVLRVILPSFSVVQRLNMKPWECRLHNHSKCWDLLSQCCSITSQKIGSTNHQLFLCVWASLFSQGFYSGSSAAISSWMLSTGSQTEQVHVLYQIPVVKQNMYMFCTRYRQSNITGTCYASQPMHKPQCSNSALCSTAAVHTGVHTLSASPHIWLWIPKTGGRNAGHPLCHLLCAVLWFLSTNVHQRSQSWEKAAVDTSKFRKEFQTLLSLQCGWQE